MASVWLFGYGSLVWRPAFEFVDRRAARLPGWRRRFWLESTDHRGTPQAPGRVLTLVRDPDATVWGTAYAIAPASWPDIEAGLTIREQQGYDHADVVVGLAAGEHAGPIADEVPVRIYIAPPTSPHYVGPEDLAATAEIVRRSHGPSGDNRSYVLELQHALAAVGAPDPEVDALAALL